MSRRRVAVRGERKSSQDVAWAAQTLGKPCGLVDKARMNLLSILIGLVALFWGLIAFTPFLGWMYWGVLPIAVIGLAFGALSSRNGGRNLNLIVLVVGFVRLALGHGLF
jgi:hypothetical protein